MDGKSDGGSFVVKIDAADMKGVRSAGDRWQSRICVNGQAVHLGTFDNLIDAQLMYYAADTQLERDKKSKKKRTVICGQCHKSFETYLSRPNRKFCSKHCVSIFVRDKGTRKGAHSPSFKGGPQVKSCLRCKVEYTCLYSRSKDSKYCTKECANRASVGRRLPASTIQKMKATVRANNLRKPKNENKCPECKTIIKKSSQYCQKHKHHTDGYKKARVKQRITVSGVMPKNIMRPGKFMNVKRGYYDINGKTIFFRSLWEVNYALYLDFLVKQKQILSWEYEKDVFIFHKIQSGTRSYRPDFKIKNNDGTEEYHEIKGWMDPKSVTKLKRMAKYYPEVKLIVIDSQSYREIKKKVGTLLSFY